MKHLFSARRRMCFLALVLVATAIGSDVMAEDYTSSLKLDRNANASEAHTFDEVKDLNFHSMKIDNFRWFKDEKPLSEWDNYSIFNSVKVRSIGYDPANRDHFEIQIISAEIKPDKVARGVDTLVCSQQNGEPRFLQ